MWKKVCCNPDCFTELERVAKAVRNWMEERHGDFVEGLCIKASERIVEELHHLGYDNAKTVDGHVKYDEPFEEEAVKPHVWVEVPCGDGFVYIDVTADQFNYGMNPEHAYEKMIVCKGYPYGVMPLKPDDV